MLRGANRGQMLSEFSPRIADAITHYVNHSPPKLACFDADGTLWAGDIGEAFLQRLISEALIPDVWVEYEHLVAVDPARAYAFAVRVMAGLSEAEVKRWAEAFFLEYEDKVFPAMRTLARELSQRGHEVWLVSGSNRWIIEAAATRLGLDPRRVIAQEVEVERGLLTQKERLPTIFGPGKVEAISTRVGQIPGFAAGNSWSDAEMLDFASTLRLLVNPTRLVVGERDLASYGRERGWLVEG